MGRIFALHACNAAYCFDWYMCVWELPRAYSLTGLQELWSVITLSLFNVLTKIFLNVFVKNVDSK